MPGLPDRPDLDQLRRQARELLRAAVGRDPAALARIRAVSERTTLSAAQLALAREYGCRTWAALRAEVERRRSPLDRWSFGGGAAIETPSGLLLPEGLIVGADDAVLSTTLTPGQDETGPDRAAPAESHASINEEILALEASTQIGDVTVVDDRGATYALRVRAAAGARGPSPKSIRFRVDPTPARGIEWLELRGQNGTAARLLPSPRAAVRIGPLTPVTGTSATGRRPDDDSRAGTPRLMRSTAPTGPGATSTLGSRCRPSRASPSSSTASSRRRAAGRCSCARVPDGGATETTGARSGARSSSGPRTTAVAFINTSSAAAPAATATRTSACGSAPGLTRLPAASG